VEWPSAPGLWGRYVSGDPIHDLASARGHEWLATCVPVQDVMPQGILSISTTFYPSTLSSGSSNTGLSSDWL